MCVYSQKLAHKVSIYKQDLPDTNQTTRDYTDI